MDQVSTGIKGLDEMLGGGFPEGRIILVCGGPGAGKTIFSIQFLMEAAKNGTRGIYLTLEEPITLVKQNLASFNWNLEEYEKKGLLKTIDYSKTAFKEGYSNCLDKGYSFLVRMITDVEDIEGKYLVIDPISSVTIHHTSASRKRYGIAMMFKMLRDTKCTCIVTSEVSPKTIDLNMKKYLADGVVCLDKSFKDFELIKSIWIEKMRGLKYDEQLRPYDITDEGLIVYHRESFKKFV